MPYRLNYFLFQIIGFFIFFGALTGRSIFSMVGVLRVFAFLTLLFICLLHNKELRFFPKKNLSKFLTVLFYLYFLFVGFLSIDAIIDSTNEGGRIYRQYFFLLVFIYEFVNFKKLTNRSLCQYLYFLITMAAAWVVINFLLYFIELPIWENYRPWVGRISNGYPTVDVICLCFALVFILLIENTLFSIRKRLIISFLIIIGIISQFSGTGSVALILILLVFFLLSLFSRDIGSTLKKNFYLCVASLLIFISVGFGYFYTREPELTEAAMSLITKKLGYFLGDDYDLPEWGTRQWGDTMEMRNDQFESNIKHLRTVSDQVIGIGFNEVTMDNGGASKRNGIFIEDQYALNYISIGNLGSLLFILFVCAPLINWIKFYRNHIAGIAFGVLCVVVFLLSCRTLITMASAQVEMFFGLIYAILLRPREMEGIIYKK